MWTLDQWMWMFFWVGLGWLSCWWVQVRSADKLIHALYVELQGHGDHCYEQRMEIERLRDAGVGYSQQTMDAVVKERDELRELLGRSDPVRCKSCDRIRERAEVICGHCTYRLDGSDLEEGT